MVQPRSTRVASQGVAGRRGRLKRACFDSAKRALLFPAHFVNTSFLYVARMGLSCARGALSASTRRVDPQRTVTWEFSAFSQNGEDGIIDQLMSLVRSPTRYFVEIGSSDGLENNTAYLAFAKKYAGLMVEGDPAKSRRSARFLQHMNWGITHLNMLVTPERVPDLCQLAVHREPDLLSLDIDGMDYYVARAVLTAGLRPKVLCVEYNSAFGPDRPMTVTYRADFDYRSAHPSLLYYGVSLAAWKLLLSAWGYRFVTVEAAGVNAFFIDPHAVDAAGLGELVGIEFAENAAQRRRCGMAWQQQFALIGDMEFHVVTEADTNSPAHRHDRPGPA